MMRFLTIVLSGVLAGTAARSPAQPARPGASVTVPRCLVSLLQESQVPAQEAGVLVEVGVREGQQVSKGKVLGQIDATQAEIAQQVAGLQLSVAQERVVNDINLRYSRAAADVAKAEYEAAIKINRGEPRTVPPMEVKRLELVWRKSTLQIEQAQHDLKVFALEAQVRQAELDAAKAQVARRQIRSPLDGVVVKIYCHAGEWFKPGDPAFHVVRMDKLRIEGFVNESQFRPSQIEDRPVSVEVGLALGRRERFSGKIEFVSPLVQAGGNYRVWAEVVNRQQDGRWVLRPGQLAQITIDLDSARSSQRPARRSSLPAAQRSSLPAAQRSSLLAAPPTGRSLPR